MRFRPRSRAADDFIVKPFRIDALSTTGTRAASCLSFISRNLSPDQ
ncbi:MAG: hypothetical protein ACYDBT_15265 [Desulfobulbaceae bacterium]